MASFLSIGERNLYNWVKEEEITFSNEFDKKNCHFCQHNEKVLNLGNEDIESLKTICNSHRIQFVCKHQM